MTEVTDDDQFMHFEMHTPTTGPDRSPVCDVPPTEETRRTTDPKRVTCPNCLGWMHEVNADFQADLQKRDEARPQVSFSANYKGVVRAPESMTAIAPTGWNLLINGVDKGDRCVVHTGDLIEVQLTRTSVHDCAVSPPTAAVKPEVINHPAHYGGDTTYEVVKVTEAWGLDKDAYLFNVVKYVARGHLKGKQIEDLEKARWYLDRRITNLKRAALVVACPRCGAPPGTFCVNEKAGPGHIEEPLLLEPEHSHEARKAAT